MFTFVLMITEEAKKVISEDDKFTTYQMNTPIYDDKGYFTHKYEDSTANIITIVKNPMLDGM